MDFEGEGHSKRRIAIHSVLSLLRRLEVSALWNAIKLEGFSSSRLVTFRKISILPAESESISIKLFVASKINLRSIGLRFMNETCITRLRLENIDFFFFFFLFCNETKKNGMVDYSGIRVRLPRSSFGLPIVESAASSTSLFYDVVKSVFPRLVFLLSVSSVISPENSTFCPRFPLPPPFFLSSINGAEGGAVTVNSTGKVGDDEPVYEGTKTFNV